MGIVIGCYLETRQALVDAGLSLERLVGLGVAAEQAGLGFVSVGDSILAKPRYAPLTVLAAVAARTRRVGLATGILRPHMRRVVPLVQEWTTLDVLSQGRTVLGVGLGAGSRALVAREYELLGVPMSQRGRLFDETLAVIRALWSRERVSFAGELLRLEDVELGMRPVQRPHPPVVVACGAYVPARPGVGPDETRYRVETAGGFAVPRGFDRVARYGDGWITGMATPEEFAAGLAQIRAVAAERHGRTLPADFRVTLNCFVNIGADTGRCRREARAMLEARHRQKMDDDTFERWAICGSAQRFAERIAAYAEAGVTHVQCILATEGAAQHRQLKALADAARTLPAAGRPAEGAGGVTTTKKTERQR